MDDNTVVGHHCGLVDIVAGCGVYQPSGDEFEGQWLL